MFLRSYFFVVLNLTKTHNWVEWTAPSVSLLQTKVNDINLNDRPQMQNDTENEIGRSLFRFIHGVRILTSFDYLHQSYRYLVFRDKCGSYNVQLVVVF